MLQSPGYPAQRWITALTFLLLFGLLCTGCRKAHRPAKRYLAKKGVLDLRHAQFTDSIKLDGEWELLWKKFVPRKNLEQFRQSKTVNVPGGWTHRSNKHLKLPPTGYATYRLRILLPRLLPDGLMLRVSRVYSNYELWVNGSKKMSVGRLSKTPNQSVMELREKWVYLPQTREVELRFLVSNHKHRTGGLRRSLSLGSSTVILAETRQRDINDGILAAVIFAVGLFFFAIGGVRREASWLWFAAFCISTAIRAAVTNDGYAIRFLLYWFDTTAMLRLEYVSIYGIQVTLIGSMAYTFPKQAPWKESHMLMGIGLVFVPGSAILPLSWVLDSLAFYGVLAIATVGMVFWISGKAWYHKERLAGAIFVTLSIALLAFVNDIGMALGYLPSFIELAPLSFILFVFIYTYAMALRFADSYDKIKKLSDDLQVAHNKLKVTHELTLLELEEFRQMGNYQLEELLGAGGMGEVWRASHRLLARPAAVKLILPEMYAQSNEQGLLRFEREARVIAQLRSPHTVELYDFGESPQGELFYAMELLNGLDLEKLVLTYGPMPPARTIHILKQACLSLAEAHNAGLVHRDIKPPNLFLCRMGEQYDFVKVLDFGLVKALQPGTSKEDMRTTGELLKDANLPFDEATLDTPTLKRQQLPTGSHQGISGEIMQPLTMLGTITGTPAFMAPEQINQDAITGKVDLYAMGCIGYWLLTGKQVFESSNTFSLLSQHMMAQPTPIQEVSMQDIPEGLQEIIHQCLQKRPSKRPESASEMYKVLEELSQEHPWTHKDALAWWEAHPDLEQNQASMSAFETTQVSDNIKL